MRGAGALIYDARGKLGDLFKNIADYIIHIDIFDVIDGGGGTEVTLYRWASSCVCGKCVPLRGRF